MPVFWIIVAALHVVTIAALGDRPIVRTTAVRDGPAGQKTGPRLTKGPGATTVVVPCPDQDLTEHDHILRTVLDQGNGSSIVGADDRCARQDPTPWVAVVGPSIDHAVTVSDGASVGSIIRREPSFPQGRSGCR